MFDFNRALSQRGLAATTSATMNADQLDTPPGAPPYVDGPLSIPKPTPAPSLTTLANGGFNHAEAWMAGQNAPQSQFEQQPFNSGEVDSPPGAPAYPSGPLGMPPARPGSTPGTRSAQDTPPGAPPYAEGPLAMPPTPTPRPSPDFIKKFSFSSAFNDQPAY